MIRTTFPLTASTDVSTESGNSTEVPTANTVTALRRASSFFVALVRAVEEVRSRGQPRCDARLEASATDVGDPSGARTTVFELDVPPLRERKEDIPQLIDHFLRDFSRNGQGPAKAIAPDAYATLTEYPWPGNVRELENVVERAVLLADAPVITTTDLQIGDQQSATSPEKVQAIKIPPTGIALEEIERQAVIEALRMSNWVQKDAAELLAISPRVINYKIRTLGIDFPRGRRAALATHEGLPTAV